MQAMLARVTEPGSYQAFQHFITHAPWSADRVWRQLRRALPVREGLLILDATTFLKQGRQSVGVMRQYSGLQGQIVNCQAAVTAALWRDGRAYLVGAALYLPQVWMTDAARTRAHIPATVPFREKCRLALTLIRQAQASGLRLTGVLADAAFGDKRKSGAKTRFFYVHLPAKASLTQLVRFAHQRWPIEQQYQELKTELGFDHFEGRTYPGWHHHVVLTAIAYNFLQVERRRAGSRLTFPLIRAVVQEIFTAYLFAQRPHNLKRIEALRSVQLRI
jgi:SRSO17 transposase